MRRFFVFCLLGLLLTAPAFAATITVDTTNDEWDLVPDAECSLREAVESANQDLDFGGCAGDGVYGDDVIILPAGTYGLTLGPPEPPFTTDNSVGDLDITIPGLFGPGPPGPGPGLRVEGLDHGFLSGGSTTIQGAGAETTVIERQSAEVFGIFEIVPTPATLEDVTIRGGEQIAGGGILSGSDLTLRRVVVRDNVARSDEPDGGGIYLLGRLDLIDSLITDNRAVVTADLDPCNAGGGGGLYFQNLGTGVFGGPVGPSLIDGTTVSDNQVLVDASCGVDGFAYGGGAALLNSGELRVVNSTVSGNTAQLSGGLDLELLFGFGGPEPPPPGLSESERAARRRDRPATSGTWDGLRTATGLRLDRGIILPAEITTSFEHLTITENTAEEIGGLGLLSFELEDLVLENTLIGGNTAGDAPDCSNAGVTVISEGINLLSIDDPLEGELVCLTDPPNLVGTLADPLEPLLGPLQDNGGPTPTHFPGPGSPAVDAAPDQGETVDQRDVPRPQGSAFDIGAVEVAEVDLTITKTDSDDPVQRGATFTYELTATNVGTTDAVDVVIQDPLIPFAYVSATPSAGGDCFENFPIDPIPPGINPMLLCVFPGATGPGESRTVTLEVTVPADTTPGVTATNTATVSSSSPEADPDPTPNEAMETTTVAAADLSLTKTVETTPGTAVFTVTATNLGPDEALDVVIEDTLPLGLQFVSAAPSAGGVCSTPAVGSEGGTVTCTFAGSTDVGEMRSVVITTAVVGASVEPNTATAVSATGDPVPDPNPNVATAAIDAFVIPTLGEWALLLLTVLLAGAGVFVMRR